MYWPSRAIFHTYCSCHYPTDDGSRVVMGGLFLESNSIEAPRRNHPPLLFSPPPTFLKASPSIHNFLLSATLQGFSVVIWASLSFLWLPGSYIYGYHENSEVCCSRIVNSPCPSAPFIPRLPVTHASILNQYFLNSQSPCLRNRALYSPRRRRRSAWRCCCLATFLVPSSGCS